MVILIDVENQHEINTLHLENDIACLSWTQNTKEFRDDTDDYPDNRLVNTCELC